MGKLTEIEEAKAAAMLNIKGRIGVNQKALG